MASGWLQQAAAAGSDGLQPKMEPLDQHQQHHHENSGFELLQHHNLIGRFQDHQQQHHHQQQQLVEDNHLTMGQQVHHQHLYHHQHQLHLDHLQHQQQQLQHLEQQQQQQLAQQQQQQHAQEQQQQQQQQQQLDQQKQQEDELKQKHQPVTRRKRGSASRERTCKIPASTAGKRSSIYRGVTRHRWTGRYEAHLWDKSTWNHSQNKKGKQVYLGAYDEEEAAARAYDLAALKYWGPGTLINFPVTDYTKDIDEMQNVTREEYLASLRRKSSGFSRGVSKYRGVARHHHNGRWEARIGRVFGNKYLYLGTYSTQEEAAAAYDMAAIEYRGLNAVTNFDLSRYIRWLRPGANPAAAATAAAVAATGEVINNHPAEELSLHKFQGLPEPPTRVWPIHNSTGDGYGQQQQHLPCLALSSRENSTASVLPRKATAASPTALGLLLQSSMFRQMLEKTTTARHSDELNMEIATAAGGPLGHEHLYLGGHHHQYLSEQQHQVQQQHHEDEESETGNNIRTCKPETYTFLGGASPSLQSDDVTEGDGNVDSHQAVGLSLWNSLGGSNLTTLPLANAIGC